VRFGIAGTIPDCKLSNNRQVSNKPDAIQDIRNLIENNMPFKQREVLLAFLNGQSYNEIHVTEKHWRYHFSKGVEFIKKELGL